jgi:DNA-binding transcriptional LysR family regulator
MVIRQLVYLTALARERHFARAAAASGVSQPALSAGIRQLEEELGVPIVARGQRFQGFTPEGERVLDWAHRILADCDALRQELGEMRQSLTGRLRLGVVPSALSATARFTAPFAARHPGIGITILSMTSIQIERALEAFEIDAGLTYLDNEPLERVRTLPLYRERYLLLVAAEGPLARRRTIAWAEAAELRLALLTPDMQNRRILDGIFAGAGRAPRVVVESNSLMALAAHVAASPGDEAGAPAGSVVPESMVAGLGVPEGTKVLSLTDPIVTHLMGLVMADRDPPPPLARALFAEALAGADPEIR